MGNLTRWRRGRRRTLHRNVRATSVLAIMLALSLALAACSRQGDEGGGDAGGGGGGEEEEAFTIGLLLPESQTARYEAFDRPYFEEKIAAECPDCEVLYQNANQDAQEQLSQIESVITQGVDVLVLDPVDAASVGGAVTQAEQQGIPVVAYDRLAEGPIAHYVSFDNVEVGRVQGEALLEALQAGGDPKRGQVVMINGSPTDPNAAMFKQGAHEVLDGQVTIGQEYDTPDWSADEAQREMDQAITALGAQNIIGVYAANDGTAGGAIAAMKSAGINPLPPVTGQDAELAAIQRIVAGEQYMTVYKAIRPEAETAAEMALALARGEEYQGETTPMDNGTLEVPSVLLEPVAVTQDDIADTVVADEFYSVEEICTEQFAAACQEIGLS